MICPQLQRGTHFEITDRWPVEMKTAVGVPLPIFGEPLDFHSGEIHLARWDGEFFHIMPGYACDGYSPVLRIFGRWVRLTPAPACGLWPAVLHDALRIAPADASRTLRQQSA